MKYETRYCNYCGEKHNGSYYCQSCIKDMKRKIIQETKPCYYCRYRKPIDEMWKESHKYICYSCFYELRK